MRWASIQPWSEAVVAHHPADAAAGGESASAHRLGVAEGEREAVRVERARHVAPPSADATDGCAYAARDLRLYATKGCEEAGARMEYRHHRAGDPHRGLARGGLRGHQQPRAPARVVARRGRARAGRPEPPATITFGEPTARTQRRPLTVVEADPPRRFSFRWVTTRRAGAPDNSLLVTFDLRPVGRRHAAALRARPASGSMGWEAAVLEEQYQRPRRRLGPTSCRA